MLVGDFLNYAKAQDKTLKTITGIIVYPEGIPQDVIIIPYEAEDDETLVDIVNNVLKQSCSRGILTYFQNIRWVLPDLETELKGWHFLRGTLRNSNYFAQSRVKLSYGKITFDQTYIHLEPKEQNIYGKLFIEVLSKKYEVDIEEFPREVGVPKLFEKINK
jgi:hypothetical protein